MREVPGHGRARPPTTSSPRSTRRCSPTARSCFVPKGVRCPMELSRPTSASTPPNTGQFERTLIVAEEGAYVSYLEGCTAPMRDENQLHAAVVELVALRRRADQVLDGAELVPRRQGRQGRDLQLRDQARQVRGRALTISWTQVETGSAITWKYPSLHPAGRRLGGRVLLGGGDQQPAAGRHRHQDDPHRQEHEEHHRVEGDLRRPRPEHLPRPRAHRQGRRRRPQLLAVRLAAHRRRVRGPHLPLHRRAELHRPDGARGHHLEDRRGPALLLPVARHLAPRTRST